MGFDRGSAYDLTIINLSCQGRSISYVKFTSFGNPMGTCGSLTKGICEETKDALSILLKVLSFCILYLHH